MDAKLQEQMNRRVEERNRNLWSRYAELLQGGDSSEAAMNELDQVMLAIGRTPDQMANDLAVLQRAWTQVETIQSSQGARELASAADRRVQEHADKMQKTMRALNLEHQKLVAECSALSNRVLLGQTAVRMLQSLQSQHVELLKHLPQFSIDQVG